MKNRYSTLWRVLYMLVAFGAAATTIGIALNFAYEFGKLQRGSEALELYIKHCRDGKV